MLVKRVIILFLLLSSAYSHAVDYKLWNRNYDTAPVDKIVVLALQQTEDLYGKSNLIRSKPMEQDQAFDNLENQQSLDLLSAAASTELEKRFLVVRFPLLKGLLGHRICFIRPGDQTRFNNIRTAYDFRANKIKICQGESWPDTQVLRRNGALLSTSAVYTELFDMLSKGKCDCFLRGAQEIVKEYEIHKHELDIEQKIAVQYMQPGLLYVSKSNPELAARIELGLLRAHDNGTYEKLFEDLLGTSIDQLKLAQRHYISLDNPYQPSSLDLIKSKQSLWFEP